MSYQQQNKPILLNEFKKCSVDEFYRGVFVVSPIDYPSINNNNVQSSQKEGTCTIMVTFDNTNQYFFSKTCDLVFGTWDLSKLEDHYTPRFSSVDENYSRDSPIIFYTAES